MPRGYQYMADVSSNNGDIFIQNYSRAGHVILGIKATQGEHYVNPYHGVQSQMAHDYGLTVLHYHFCEPEDVQPQIDHFRETYIRHWRKGDYACFDVEKGQPRSFVAEILNKYYKETQNQPILYCDNNDWVTKYNGVWVPGKRLWIADYSLKPVIIDRKHYVLWARQYTNGETGPPPHAYTGIGKCDGSVVSFGPATALALRKIRTRRKR